MKYCLLIVCALTTAVISASAADPANRVKHKGEFFWDEKELDTPPLPMGGESALAKGIVYTDEMLKRHLQGKTTVTVIVDDRGGVQAIRFKPHLIPTLESVVSRAVRACQWTPGMWRGAPVAGSVSFSVDFVLAKGPARKA